MTAEEIRIALGLLPFDDYAAKVTQEHVKRVEHEAGLTAYLRCRNRVAVRCRKCVARANGRRSATRAHAHGCPERGKGHAGLRLRKEAQYLYLRYYVNTRTGRTTRLLCDALATLSNGEGVILIGHSANYARSLARQVLTMAHRCRTDLNGLQHNYCLVGSKWPGYRVSVYGSGEPVVYADHVLLQKGVAWHN